MKSTQNIPNEKFDTLVLAVSHQEFSEMNLKSLLKPNHVVYDVKNALKPNQKDGGL